MASTVTISPTIGHPVLHTQYNAAGGAPVYDAVDLRRMLAGAAIGWEGVADVGGWLVGARADEGRGVDVAANVGLARVTGDSVALQGPYIVAPHSAVVTLDASAAHPTNPRVDMVYLQVRDEQHDGGTDTDARLVYATGTATAGANATNRSGAPALPATALWLADVVVAAGGSSWTIVDRRTVPGHAVDRLPSSPVDGQECLYLADGTGGVVWRLKYRAASASSYKWEMVGGGPLRAAAAGGTPGSTSYADLTATPSLTVPVAGDYRVVFGARVAAEATSGLMQVYLSPYVGAAATDTDAALVLQTKSPSYPITAPVVVSLLKTAVAAAATVKLQGRYQTSFGTGAISGVWLELHPVRVG